MSKQIFLLQFEMDTELSKSRSRHILGLDLRPLLAKDHVAIVFPVSFLAECQA